MSSAERAVKVLEVLPILEPTGIARSTDLRVLAAAFVNR